MLIYLLIISCIKSPSQNLSGTITLTNLTYKSLCYCGSQPDQTGVSQCKAQDIKIQTSRPGIGYSADIVKDIVESPKTHVYVDIIKQPFFCMDGRNVQNGIYTPGGDFGEFLLALHVYEGITQILSKEHIQKLLETYLDTMDQPYFYFCTDDLSVHHIEKELNKSFSFDRLLEPFFQDRKELLGLLMKPENQGDDHIKNILNYPQYYSIRDDLTKGLIEVLYQKQAFYNILWQKGNPRQTKLKLDSLSGRHSEGAFVEVRVNNSCQEMNLNPLIRTQLKLEKSLQVYINNIDAVQIKRNYISEFFIKKINEHNDTIDPLIMKNRMNRHGLAFLEITGSLIAKDLPFFTITLK